MTALIEATKPKDKSVSHGRYMVIHSETELIRARKQLIANYYSVKVKFAAVI